MLTVLIHGALVHFTAGLCDSVEGLRSYKSVCDQSDKTARSSRSSSGLSVLASRRNTSAKTDDNPKSKRLVNTMVQCCLWNGGVCGISLLIFWALILPLLEYITKFAGFSPTNRELVWSYTRTAILYTFHSLWVIPMMLLGKFVNCVWFQDLADVVWLMTQRSRQAPLRPPQMSLVLADIPFSLLAETLFLIQGEAFMQIKNLLPTGIPIQHLLAPLSLLHTSLLYAMYAFEYKWQYEGLGIKTRMAMIESQWLYYLGFGMPLSFITWYPESYFTRCVLFSLGFPWLILGAFCANEKVLGNLGLRVRFFAASYWLTNKLFELLFRKTLPPTSASVRKAVDYHSSAAVIKKQTAASGKVCSGR